MNHKQQVFEVEYVSFPHFLRIGSLHKTLLLKQLKPGSAIRATFNVQDVIPEGDDEEEDFETFPDFLSKFFCGRKASEKKKSMKKNDAEEDESKLVKFTVNVYEDEKTEHEWYIFLVKRSVAEECMLNYAVSQGEETIMQEQEMQQEENNQQEMQKVEIRKDQKEEREDQKEQNQDEEHEEDSEESEEDDEDDEDEEDSEEEEEEDSEEEEEEEESDDNKKTDE